MKKIVLSMTTLLTAGLLMSACNGGEKKEEQKEENKIGTIGKDTNICSRRSR